MINKYYTPVARPEDNLPYSFFIFDGDYQKKFRSLREIANFLGASMDKVQAAFENGTDVKGYFIDELKD